MKQEQVNHPKHYNSHPAGIECIDIIRHYTCDIANAIKYCWRAGLKPEMGKEDAEKEIEDLKKSLWYINDYKNAYSRSHTMSKATKNRIEAIVPLLTGHSISEIVSGYTDDISDAIKYLLCVGIIYQGKERCCTLDFLDKAKNAIQHRIFDIKRLLMNKDIDDTLRMMKGQPVEGEDYVAKPGGKREDEPDSYDPLNLIIVSGHAFGLTDAIRKRPNGSLYSPCDNCELSDGCNKPSKILCSIHGANEQQYYQEVGVCKYSPSFGTIEVCDEHKLFEKELRELEAELEAEEDNC